MHVIFLDHLPAAGKAAAGLILLRNGLLRYTGKTAIFRREAKSRGFSRSYPGTSNKNMPMDSMHPRQEPAKCAGAALAALVISAVILVSGYILWSMNGAGGTNNLPPLEITSNDFLFDSHTGKRIPGGLEIKAPGPNRQSIVQLSRTGFDAEQYPLLRYHISGYKQGLSVALFWRSSVSPKTTRFAELPKSFLEDNSFSLEHNAWWKGTITDLGFNIMGGRPGERLLIRDLEFSPPGPVARLRAVLSEWSTLEAWSMSSINFIYNASPSARLSPVLAGAAWAGLAGLLYAGWNFKRYRKLLPPRCSSGLLVLILIPWLILYGRWQINFWTQLDTTRQLYAGKSQEEKHQRAEDAVIYDYAQHLKQDVLPQAPARIVILRKAYRDYLRLKLQYYLLPHNSYNYDSLPQAAYLHDGDYLLVLGSIPGLRYDTANKRLKWSQGRQVKALLLDKTNLGSLYQVKIQPGKQP